MTSAMLLLPFAVAAIVLWVTYRMAERETALATTALVQQPVAQRLRERLTRGEISADDYDRLLALMR